MDGELAYVIWLHILFTSIEPVQSNLDVYDNTLIFGDGKMTCRLVTPGESMLISTYQDDTHHKNDHSNHSREWDKVI